MNREIPYDDLKLEYERAKVYIKAAHDLLQKQKDSYYVLDLLDETVVYDDADCDGYCLYEETGEWLEWQEVLAERGSDNG